MKHKSFWRLIAKSLGEKAGKTDQEADKIALIRLLMFLSILITNCFIVANALRHWNDVPSNLPETKKERILNTNCNVSQN
jgi:hypothetical protein